VLLSTFSTNRPHSINYSSRTHATMKTTALLAIITAFTGLTVASPIVNQREFAQDPQAWIAFQQNTQEIYKIIQRLCSIINKQPRQPSMLMVVIIRLFSPIPRIYPREETICLSTYRTSSLFSPSKGFSRLYYWLSLLPPGGRPISAW